jgi:hypothetical protein
VKAIYEDGVLVDSNTLALRWELANPERCKELNDVLDRMTLEDRRAFYAGLSDEEQNGIISEYTRRRADEEAPVGTMVTAKDRSQGMNVWEHRPRGIFSFVYTGTATVIGHGGHGSYERLLLLHQTKDVTLRYGWANSSELEVLA